jgi:signal peptidase I
MLKKYIPNPILRNILEWAIAIALALLVFFAIDSFVFKSARVYGGSMEPSFGHNDRVIVNRLTFRFREPAFGDIIAFPYAGSMGGENVQNYIKRIVGIPGDIIDIAGGYIYRNGARLDCAHLQGQGRVFAGTATFPMTIPDDYFFVLGDNLPLSSDSRFANVGNIHIDDIIGRVNFRWFPFSGFGFVN